MKIPPDIVLAGFPKCATSTLAEQLVRMPEIEYHIPEKKEPHTYLYRWRECLPSAETTTYQRAQKQAGMLLLDASTGYAVFPEGLCRIAKANPDATILFILRDPLERLRSHMNWISKVEARVLPFDVQLKLAPYKGQYSSSGNLLNFLLTSSYYAKTILHARKLFKRVHIVYFSEFTRDQPAALAEIRQLLGLPDLALDQQPLQRNSTQFAQQKVRKRAPINFKTIPMKLSGAWTTFHRLLTFEVVYRLRFGSGTVATADLTLHPSIEQEVLHHIAKDVEQYEAVGIQLDKFPTLKKALHGGAH